MLSRIAFFAEVKPSEVANVWTVASLARVESSEDLAISERSVSGMLSMLSRIAFFAEVKLSEVANVWTVASLARMESSEDLATSERSATS